MKRKSIIIFGLIIMLTLSSLTFAYADNNYRQKNMVETKSISKVRDKEQSNEIKVTKEITKVEKEYITIYVETPVISGLNNKEFQRELNAAIKSKIIEEVNEFEEEAKKIIEEDKKQGKIPKEMEYELKYEEKNSIGVLTIILETYSYLGGANGTNKNYYFNALINENSLIQLSQLFRPGSNYKEKINDEINRQITERIKKGDTFYKGENRFETIADNHDFYIEDNNLVIAFAQYSIAPRNMGIVEFSIPMYQLRHLLKNPFSLIDGNVYYNSGYDFQIKLPDSWEDLVYIEEINYEKNVELKVNFIYTPKNSKLNDYNLMTIIVLKKNVYFNLSKDEVNKLDVIGTTNDYVYVVKSYSNPYSKGTIEYKEYKALSAEIDSIKYKFNLEYDSNSKLENISDYKWVIINGKKENLNKNMYKTKNGTIMIPIGKVAKKLGYKVKWNPREKTVTIDSGIESIISIGDYNYGHLKLMFKLEEAATIEKGTVFVPISYLEQVLELKVEVDSNGVLTISSK